MSFLVERSGPILAFSLLGFIVFSGMNSANLHSEVGKSSSWTYAMQNNTIKTHHFSSRSGEKDKEISSPPSGIIVPEPIDSAESALFFRTPERSIGPNVCVEWYSYRANEGYWAFESKCHDISGYFWKWTSPATIEYWALNIDKHDTVMIYLSVLFLLSSIVFGLVWWKSAC